MHNDQYGIIDTLQARLKSVTSDGTLLISAFGGVVGVGKSVLSGFFTFLTILVLTLYFITSLPQAVNLGLSLVPASRRERVGRLTNAIITRVGSFVGSQIVIAAMASVFVFTLSIVLGLPSPISVAYSHGSKSFKSSTTITAISLDVSASNFTKIASISASSESLKILRVEKLL